MANGTNREDQRLRLTGGLDLSGLYDGPDLEIGVQYQKVWSNDPTAERDRFFFPPTLVLRHSFK